MADVASPRGNAYRLAVNAELEAAQYILHRLGGNVGAEQSVYLVRAQREHGGLGNVVYDVDNAVNNFASAEHFDQLAGSVYCRKSVQRVKTLFKLCRSLGAHTKRQCALADAGSVKVCRLENNINRVGNNLAVLAAHDACKADRASIVRDNENVGVELSDISVERCKLLALGGAAHDDPAALDVAVVECVHRLAVFHHDVVCDINDVVYRPYAHCAQSLAHPLRGGSDLNIAYHARGVSRAEIGSRGFDRQKLGENAVCAALDDRLVCFKLFAEGRGGLACKTDDRQAVGAVGGYLKLNDVIVCADDGLDVVAGLYAVLVQDEYTVGDAVGELGLLGVKIIESADALAFCVVCCHVADVYVLASSFDNRAAVAGAQGAFPEVDSGVLNGGHGRRYDRSENLVTSLDIGRDRGLILVQRMIVVQKRGGAYNAIGEVALVKIKLLERAEHAV